MVIGVLKVLIQLFQTMDISILHKFVEMKLYAKTIRLLIVQAGFQVLMINMEIVIAQEAIIARMVILQHVHGAIIVARRRYLLLSHVHMGNMEDPLEILSAIFVQLEHSAWVLVSSSRLNADLVILANFKEVLILHSCAQQVLIVLR